MQARVIPAAEAQRLSILGIDHLMRINGADTDNSMVFLEVQLTAGMGIPRHTHTREDELFHVLTGEVEFELADRRLVAPAGTTLLGPRNIPHSYRAANDRPATFLVTVTPAGIEHMFTELSKLPPGPPDLQRVAQIVGRYGISFA